MRSFAHPGQRAEDGVEGGVDGVVEQVADDVRDVEQVEVDGHRVDVDLPVVGDAGVVRVPVVHARRAARVDAYFVTGRDRGRQLEAHERRDVEAEVRCPGSSLNRQILGACTAQPSNGIPMMQKPPMQISGMSIPKHARELGELQVELA